ncbi:hypothetical protein EJB05_43544 [Eragrostis curvula]|uniref:Myb-like domain-containing protein n=1 Tax=Eragrostis curvula TaxID=38414 RepID=A0A5J9TFD5_9POAL|nr:hypothetical protein EJB05_43544 [Eragrostis curvula]
MGDGSDGTDVSPESEAAAEKRGEIWGTLEELLLAYAVNRHGTSSWDSVAMEVKTRSPLAARPGLTPHSCRLRFRHLHRRFSSAGSSGEGDGDDPDASAAEGWVDELRRLRVAELRRDVERCDLSIGTLQLKVKRLREERERSVSGDAKLDEASGNDRLSGEEPGRSCRESNSTDLKPPEHPGGKGGVKEEEVAKQEASGESAAASKESSDVRSSASLCRRRRGKASGAEEEEAASAPRPTPAQSLPLAALLDAVAAKLGTVMERLHEHESEEGAAYRSTIRRHVDLETVRGKLEASAASRADDDDFYPAAEFYRDLLLLCTNVVVFLPPSVPEHAAAVEARALVSEHASAVLREPKQDHVVAVPAAASGPVPAPAGADIVGPLIEKGKPLIVCRKRSSIAKAASMKKQESAEKSEGEKEQEESEDEKEAVATVTKDKTWGLRTKRGGAVKRLASRKLADDTAMEEDTSKAGKKGGAGVAEGGLAKKRNAVDFLKRLNSSPTKKRGSPLGTTRRRKASAAMAEQPQTRKRGTGRKDGTGRGGGKRGGKAGVAKRGVGRPLKRGPAPATPPPSKRAKTNRSEKPASTGKRGGRRSVG